MRKRLTALLLALILMFSAVACGDNIAVEFDADDGSAVESVIGKGKIIDEAPVTEKPGYTFAGWFDGQTKVDFPYTVTKKKTLKAKWDIITYTITFNSDGGGAVEPVKYTVADEVSLPAPAKKEHFTFAGWYNNPGKSGNIYRDLPKGSTGDKQYWADWKEDVYLIEYVEESLQGCELPEERVKSYSFSSAAVYLVAAGSISNIKEGYAFGGWYDNSGFSGDAVTVIPSGSTGDRRFFAKWNAIGYTITLDSRGGPAVNSINFNVDSGDITLPDPPERDHYTFGGWYTSTGFTTQVVLVARGSTGSRTYYAKWVPDEYGITYERNGGVWETGVTPPDKYVYNTALPLPSPQKAGYTFTGWYDNAALTGTGVFEIAAGSSGVKTLYAGWNADAYTITYNRNGGSGPAAGSYTVEDIVTLPATARAGYTFGGWYDNPGLTGSPVTQIPPGSMEDKEFWAKWTLITYNVTYNLNGGTDAANRTYTVETPTFDLAVPQKDGYTFKGWYANAGLTGSPVTQITLGSTENKEFWAQWEIIINSNIITYNSNKGILPQDAPGGYDDGDAFLLPIPARTGYGFDGWHDNSGLTGTPVAGITAQDRGNKVFWAKWTPVNYNVTYNLNGGSGAANRTYTIETLTFDLAVPARTGYNFAGWFDNETFEGSAVTQIVLGSTYHKTFWAKWTLITYNITYNRNGGSGAANRTYTIETPTFDLAVPALTGHDFGGWFESATFAGTAVTKISLGSWGHKTFYAKWTPSVYNITYVLGGGALPNGYITSYTYNVAATLPIPERSGWDFDGWYADEDFSGDEITGITAGDSGHKKYYAKWRARAQEYKLTFNLNGGSFGPGQSNPIIFTSSQSVPVPDPDPIRTGYSFDGWYLEYNFETKLTDFVVPAGTARDRQVYAKWIPVKYNLTFMPDGGQMPSGHITTYTYDEYTFLPVPVKAGFDFGGWYETANPTAATAGKLGALEKYVKYPSGKTLAGAIGNKTLYALWLAPATSGTVRMEAENTDMMGISGPGFSGTAYGPDRRQDDKAVDTRSGDWVVGWTHGTDIYVYYEFTMDRAVLGAALKIGLGSELGAVTFDPESVAIIVNGVEIDWGSITVENDKIGSTTVNVSLIAGYNVISVQVKSNKLVDGKSHGGPLIDYIEVKANANIGFTPIYY